MVSQLNKSPTLGFALLPIESHLEAKYDLKAMPVPA
jgi:hypothetical protein